MSSTKAVNGSSISNNGAHEHLAEFETGPVHKTHGLSFHAATHVPGPAVGGFPGLGRRKDHALLIFCDPFGYRRNTTSLLVQLHGNGQTFNST
ncbi:hypothetical protein CI238_07115 [Colletotrichum incanum]|uniref:Uncharacterized protein n=1 Tax=Colletotrichum incanum TaxID=1573173 RepID=A0A166MSB6_COLIC|nr:hypothetical protein CI238_07115 [Colletotrichum incanum]